MQIQVLMNSTEVQNLRHKLDDKCLCLSYVFRSVLACAKSAHVFQKRYSLCRSLSLTNNSSSDSKAFLRFIAFSGSPTAVHRPLHALRYYTVGIPFSTAHKRQSQTSKLHVHRGLIMHTNAHSHNTKCRTAGVSLFITAY